MKNQRRAVPSSDRISLLPDCILELILVLLPLQEAVRTCILSRRWTSLWTQVPKLVFDKAFFQSIGDKSKIMSIVQKRISRNSRPVLDLKFSLSGISSSNINQPVNSHKLYKLLSLGELRLLKSLCLETCICKFPGGFGGFNILTNLSLYEVDINGGNLSRLVKRCPLLDTLTLINLRRCLSLDLFAPNLKVFYCKVFLLGLYVGFTPRLEKMIVSLDGSNSNESNYIIMPFRRIPAIEYLELNGRFLKYMNLGNEQNSHLGQNDLSHLKSVKLNGVCFEEEDIGKHVISLLQCSPNLETFLVSASSCLPHFEPRSGVWPISDLSNVTLNRLRYLSLENIIGKQSEVQFIRMLVARSPMLETVEILLHSELTYKEGLRISEEFGRYHCKSEVSLELC